MVACRSMTDGGQDEIRTRLAETEAYLTNILLPFWLQNVADPDGHGYLTYFDAAGRRGPQTEKTFLMQIRSLYTMASAHRQGYGQNISAELAGMGAEFILDHYWDDKHDGWIWIADRAGNPTVYDKVGYGQCFAVYAFSEHCLATGDDRGRKAAERSYTVIRERMADSPDGYLELFERDWQPKPGGKAGGDRKSLDVHMHMMEAFTTLYELTGDPEHRDALQDIIDLILARMIDRETGLPYIQFSHAFEPLPAITFETEWGRDAEPGGGAHPLHMTSPGHNVEFAWLLLHAADILGQSRETYAAVLRPIFDHAVTYGLDAEHGGVYADVPMNQPTNLTDKQFWQQAETLIGMLDAYQLYRDSRYWDAFENVYRFVFDKMVRIEAGGEWVERVDRQGNVVDAELGHAWKINYHTVRGMIQVVRRLHMMQNNLPSAEDTGQ